MSRWQFSILSLFAVMSAVATIVGFVAQVGIEIATGAWGGLCFLGLVGWLIAYVISDTRGRIRVVPVLLGAIIGVSLAGMLSIALFSLDVREIDHHDHPKDHYDHHNLRSSNASAIFRSSVFWGGTLGLGIAFWGSWNSTGKRLSGDDQCDEERPQLPSALHDS